MMDIDGRITTPPGKLIHHHVVFVFVSFPKPIEIAMSLHLFFSSSSIDQFDTHQRSRNTSVVCVRGRAVGWHDLVYALSAKKIIRVTVAAGFIFFSY